MSASCFTRLVGAAGGGDRRIGHDRSRAGRARQRRGRGLEIHRAAAPHRLAEDPPVDRQGAGRGPVDRRPPRRRSAVLHREADRASRSTGSPAFSLHPDITISSVEMTDWQMLVEKWDGAHNFPPLQPRRWPAAGTEALHDHAQVSARVSRPVHVRGSRDAVERGLPQPRHQHRQPAELPRHGDIHAAARSRFRISSRCGRT